MTRLSQERAPILEALNQYKSMRVVPFDVPGHKRGKGNRELTDFLGEQCLTVDVNSMMPGKYDGLAVCRELRQKSGSIGIILLTARTQEMDKVSGLMMGADDYVTKPFSPSELVARVDAVYRRVALEQMRNENNFKEEIRSGDFALNLRNRTLMKKGEPIELTQVEFQIMEYFFSSPTAALDRTDILKHVWGDAYFGEEKIVDVNIRRLRMKVEDEPSNPKHIVTVWGLGYKWEA